MNINFSLSILVLLSMSAVVCFSQPQFPMSNDESFDSNIPTPSYKAGNGPRILIDGGHNNFFVQFNFIKPLENLLISDGYNVDTSAEKFSSDLLGKYKILVVVTPMSTNFMNPDQTYESAFSSKELEDLENWVKRGGSMLVFSEHFPFDLAVQPLLNIFGIDTSIGVVIDRYNYENNPGQILFTSDSLSDNHPVVSGKRSVKKLASYGGSALNGPTYINILKLSDKIENLKREWREAEMGPIGSGDSQGLVGEFGEGKIAAFGDSNGFFAMEFDLEDGHKSVAGMNDPSYDWKNFVLNTFDWLSLD